ncbi:MAG TPA: hypothetical protein PLL69_11195, partial [Gemmatimonadales bacterium]|nr:hypothetical protein [Gemmatimonadales bacterium]
VALLDDLSAAAGGDRIAVVGRELTKLHEEVRRGALLELAEHYRSSPPLGEVTLVMAGTGHESEPGIVHDPDAVSKAVAEWLAAGESRREVMRKVMDEFGLSRNDAYRLVMEP